MTIRRVVTGHDCRGKARVVGDDEVEPITSELMPGYAAYRLWGRDERPAFPDDGSPRRAEAYYPPRNDPASWSTRSRPVTWSPPTTSTPPRP
ncbi:hypothetical protein [Kibdelosporangium phytohabitans]|uniref:hypothetical protein n=1 Tax=Kibdelosporangium phytohabitans TaxID=860235 RepID=UPI0012FC1424|nr:hypothetical protein [Kibdelosporangium phytohabitans]MBE1470617.1 hypothetical protein [Kibdelosporangium phytohabitans]